MKKVNAKSIIVYLLGLMVMALGIMLMKKAVLGITPVSSVPLSLSEAIPALSFGAWTTVFQVACTVAVIIVEGKITIKNLLLFPMSIIFGMFLDAVAVLMTFKVATLLGRYGILVFGIFVESFGIATVNKVDLMLPSPDTLIRSVSYRVHMDYPLVKNIGDCIWIAIAVTIELTSIHKLQAVYIGTVVAAILMGRFIKFWNITVYKPKKAAAQES